jgi:hypothetical protein
MQLDNEHYKKLPLQPLTYIQANSTVWGRYSYLLGQIVKYVSRAPLKGGVQDLYTAKFYLDTLIETYEKEQ